MVLEDGRVIEEDDPEITVDTVEDTENFSDDADDDIKNIGGSLVPVSKRKFFKICSHHLELLD